jgi:hypothetical protein
MNLDRRSSFRPLECETRLCWIAWWSDGYRRRQKMGCAQVMLGSASPARRALAVLLVAMTLLAGCDRKPPQISQSARRANGPPHQLTKSEMSEAEQKYGIAPIPDPSVTYQPAVILVGGGAEAIRELSPNGFMWTIDGSAPHANELVPGKIFFMTGRAVGRVLDVRKDGGNLVVTVGPVDITEVISADARGRCCRSQPSELRRRIRMAFL